MNGLTMALLLASASIACASISPASPRFVSIFDQRNDFCRIQVIKDTRSAGCYVAFRCARQPVVVLAADPAVCVP